MQWEGSFRASPPRQHSALFGQVPGAAPPWRAHLIPKDLKGVRRGYHMAGNARHVHQWIMDGTDRKGKLHCHLAFQSVCSHLSPLLPPGTHLSTLDKGKGMLQTSWRALPCPHCPLTHPKPPGQGHTCCLGRSHEASFGHSPILQQKP